MFFWYNFFFLIYEFFKVLTNYWYHLWKLSVMLVREFSCAERDLYLFLLCLMEEVIKNMKNNLKKKHWRGSESPNCISTLRVNISNKDDGIIVSFRKKKNRHPFQSSSFKIRHYLRQVKLGYYQTSMPPACCCTKMYSFLLSECVHLTGTKCCLLSKK